MSADGGPAFPVSWQDGDGQMVADPGMSLRDWFAGQALAGSGCGFASDGPIAKLLRWLWVGDDMTDEEIAERAYEQADAMLAAREAKP